MTDLTTANQLAADRGYQEWIDAQPEQKMPLLARASDYIMGRYLVKSTLTEAETAKLDLATFLIANDLLANPGSNALRAEQPIKKTDDRLGAMVTTVEYFDAPADPYPTITALLAPLVVTAPISTGKDFYSGRQRV